MENNISILDQLATHAINGVEEGRSEHSGAIAAGRWALDIIRVELPGIDPKDIGAVLLIFSSLVASLIESQGDGPGVAVGNLAAMIGSHLYAEKEL